jgi:hypothetical protein
MTKKYIFILLLAATFAASCDRRASTANQSIPMESNTVLYRITGLTGLVEHGDELVAMTFPRESREASIRQENINAAQSSLRDKNSGFDLEHQGDERFVRVRDVDDETGHRFFYFERNANGSLAFRGVCSESWGGGPQSDPSLAVCDITYPLEGLIVYFEVSEKVFIAHGEEIAKRVLEVVRANQ